MRPTGVLRPLDRMGRVVIPKEYRRYLDLENERDLIEVTLEEDKIVLRKFVPDCIFCNSSDNVVDFGGRTVCSNCIEKLNILKEQKENHNQR